MPIDFDRFDVLTFDCYGTLIDWETGLLEALRARCRTPGWTTRRCSSRPPRGGGRAAAVPELPGGAGGEPARRRSRSRARRPGGCGAPFSESVRDWPAFPDSADALRRLQERFRLGVITNCDTDLFAASNQRLGVVFDWVVTAELARSYKPSPTGFELAFETIGSPRQRILHVAQSLFHDHVPAKRLGLTTVWIDRRHDRPGTGATPPADAVPDATYPNMASFAEQATKLRS